MRHPLRHLGVYYFSATPRLMISHNTSADTPLIHLGCFFLAHFPNNSSPWDSPEPVEGSIVYKPLDYARDDDAAASLLHRSHSRRQLRDLLRDLLLTKLVVG